MADFGLVTIPTHINPGDPNAQWPILERYAGLIRRFN